MDVVVVVRKDVNVDVRNERARLSDFESANSSVTTVTVSQRRGGGWSTPYYYKLDIWRGS